MYLVTIGRSRSARPFQPPDLNWRGYDDTDVFDVLQPDKYGRMGLAAISSHNDPWKFMANNWNATQSDTNHGSVGSCARRHRPRPFARDHSNHSRYNSKVSVSMKNTGIYLALDTAGVRLFCVWVLAHGVPAVTRHWGFGLMVLSWGLVEVPRYLFYTCYLYNKVRIFAMGMTISVTFKVPSWLFFLRYHLFLVLYPSGFIGTVQLWNENCFYRCCRWSGLYPCSNSNIASTSMCERRWMDGLTDPCMMLFYRG